SDAARAAGHTGSQAVRPVPAKRDAAGFRCVQEPERNRGFTLLEMLLVMVLLAFLLAGAYGGIRAAANAMHAGERAIDRTDRIRTAQEFLRRQFSHILPLAFSQESDTGAMHVFDANAHFMRFVAPMPGYLSRGGPYVQTLELVSG